MDSTVAVDATCLWGRSVRNCKEVIVILQNNQVAAITNKTLFLLIWCVEKLWIQFLDLQNKKLLEFSTPDKH